MALPAACTISAPTLSSNEAAVGTALKERASLSDLVSGSANGDAEPATPSIFSLKTATPSIFSSKTEIDTPSIGTASGGSNEPAAGASSAGADKGAAEAPPSTSMGTPAVSSGSTMTPGTATPLATPDSTQAAFVDSHPKSPASASGIHISNGDHDTPSEASSHKSRPDRAEVTDRTTAMAEPSADVRMSAIDLSALSRDSLISQTAEGAGVGHGAALGLVADAQKAVEQNSAAGKPALPGISPRVSTEPCIAIAATCSADSPLARAVSEGPNLLASPRSSLSSDDDSKLKKRLQPLRPPALTIAAPPSPQSDRGDKRCLSFSGVNGEQKSAAERALDEIERSRLPARSQTLQGCFSVDTAPASSHLSSSSPTLSRKCDGLNVPHTPVSGSDSDNPPPTPVPQTPTVLRHLVDNFENIRSRQNSTCGSETSSNYSKETKSIMTPRGQTRFQKSDLDMLKSAKRIRTRRASVHIQGSAVQATSQMLDQVLQEERKRLKKQVVSRAYENDMRQVKMERDFLKKKDDEHGKTSLEKIADVRFFKSVAPGRQSPSKLKRSDTFMEAKHLNQLSSYLGKVGAIKWTATAIIALIIAMQAGVIILGAYYIGVWKIEVLASLSGSGGVGLVYAYLFLLSYALPAGGVSAVLVSYFAPHAGGSGIPEIKSYLNGIAQPQAFSFRTWVSRSVGLVLVTSAGLFAGTEGPFAHLGGIVASGMAEGPRCRSLWPSILSGHRNRCEFISQGAAMGVAAAFGAPIGGILFSLEEASTFWSKTLTWQAFLGTMIAAVVAKLIKSGFSGGGFVISGGGFIEFPDKNVGFEIWELFTFGIMATVMGLLGAFFCALVKRCISWRRTFFQLGSPTPASRRSRVLEVLLVVTFSISICFWPSVISGCVDLQEGTSSDERHLMGGGGTGSPDLSGGICPEGSYSDVGYLLLQPKEAAIKALFSNEMQDGAVLKIPSLMLCYLIIFGTTIVTFGSAIPVGLFIPNILAGACFGRAIGQAFLEIGVAVRPDVYALMGAAAALAGFSRMTISLAVIFVEITNNTYLGLPLMLVIMVSKMVADHFTPSVYDIVLEMNPDIHLLEDNMSEDHLLVLESLTAHDVCSAEVVVVKEFEPLPQILSLLMRSSFAGYPVVDRQNHLTGLVTRTQLAAIVEKAREEQDEDDPVNDQLIKILPLCDTPPEVTLWNAPVVRAFHHFRASGLQHLCVVGESQELLGILTRTDFSRLCHHGPEGVGHVRMLMERKQTYVEGCLQREQADLNGCDEEGHESERDDNRLPTTSTAYSESEYTGASTSGEENQNITSHPNTSEISSSLGESSSYGQQGRDAIAFRTHS